VLRLLATVALLGATGFNGTASQLVPTARDLGAVSSVSSPIPGGPPCTTRSGSRGVTTEYRKASGESISVDIFVCANTATAKSGYRQLCGACTTPQVLFTGTYEFGRYGSGIAAYATCRNVIVVTSVTGHLPEATLTHDAGFAAGWVLGRAFAPRC
jgi:hypothetical protein